MRARAGLAEALWMLGHHQEAIQHYRDMLELNPNDNQGVRYVLASCLLKAGDTEALKALFNKYETERSCMWLYTRALVAFRENSPDAKQLALKAWAANNHVPAILAGLKQPVPAKDGYIRVRGEDEATHYVLENGTGWHAVPGVTEWLIEVTDELRKG